MQEPIEVNLTPTVAETPRERRRRFAAHYAHVCRTELNRKPSKRSVKQHTRKLEQRQSDLRGKRIAEDPSTRVPPGQREAVFFVKKDKRTDEVTWTYSYRPNLPRPPSRINQVRQAILAKLAELQKDGHIPVEATEASSETQAVG